MFKSLSRPGFMWIAVLTLFAIPASSQELFDQQVDWIPEEDESHLEGSFTFANAVYEVEGNGSFGNRVEPSFGLFGDEGYYIYTSKTGSFSLQARVFPIFGQTALMIRENAEDPASNFYSIELGDTGFETNTLFRTRTGAGGNRRIQLVDSEGNPIQDTGNGLWFRVTRIAPVDIFFSEFSSDGQDWFIADNRVIEWASDTAAFGVAAGSGANDEQLGLIEVTNAEFVSPPPVAQRELSQQSFAPGDEMQITIKVYVSGQDRSTATINETVPQGWEISNVSNDGQVNGNTISWNLSDLPVGETILTYTAIASNSAVNPSTWSGNLEESVNIVGEETIPLLNIAGGERVDDGLLVLYTFNESSGLTVNDVSELGDPMNLTIEDPNAVHWGDGFLETTGVNQIVTEDPATKIIEACKRTNEVTVEGWIKTSDITQNGPARIITCSLDAFARNFTLGQGRYAEGSDRFEMRFRTTENDEWQVDSPIGSLTEALTHVVWSRASDGSVMSVINNQVQEVVLEGADPIQELPGDFSNWDESFKFGIGNEVAADRAWLGQFHLVAVYDKALSVEEVSQNFNAGPFIDEGQTHVASWSLF